MKEKIYFMDEIIPVEIQHIVLKAKKEREIIIYTKELFSDNILLHCKPIYITNSTLVFAVDNPLWGSELISNKSYILEKIGSRYESYIKEIKTKFLPNYFKNEQQKIQLTDDEEEMINNKIESIKDVDLKEKAYNLLKAFYLNEKSYKTN
ncbi:MAG TPA: DciA family protein [Exilispira sp.]|nr:DciA family protein [Exilispira sp.]